MFAGHFGAGLALKSRYPSVPLAAILAASTLPDLLWAVFQMLGWESPPAAASHLVRPLPSGPVPFSHDVSMALIDACILAAVGMLTSSLAWSMALGLAVCSHLLLDVLVDPPLLGLAGPWLHLHVGLDLWQRAPRAAWGLEMLVVLAGGGLYLRARAPGSSRPWRARAAVALLAALHLLALAPL
jgi:hypothetical protein